MAPSMVSTTTGSHSTPVMLSSTTATRSPPTPSSSARRYRGISTGMWIPWGSRQSSPAMTASRMATSLTERAMGVT